MHGRKTSISTVPSALPRGTSRLLGGLFLLLWLHVIAGPSRALVMDLPAHVFATAGIIKPSATPGTLATRAPNPPSMDRSSDDPKRRSYWGALPERSPSTSAAFGNRKRPAWETAVDLPFWLLKAPLALIALATKGTIHGLDHTGSINFVQNLFAPKEVPYKVGGSVGASGLSGFGLGLSLEYLSFFGPENKLRGVIGATTKGKRKITIGMRFPTGERNQLEIGGGYRFRPNARYFGIGPTSSEDDESFYTQEISWGGLLYARGLTSNLNLKATGQFLAVGTRAPGSDFDDQSIEDVFAGDLPPGYNDRADGINFSLKLHRNTTTETGRPSNGGTQKLFVSYYESTDSKNGDFWSYRGEIQQFFPFLYQDRAIAIRAYLSWINRVGASPIPFQLLNVNDDPDIFRGYKDFRWRDFGITELALEYRWPIWAQTRQHNVGVDMYLFTDFGQVFDDFDQISSGLMTTSYGFGLRLIGRTGFLALLEFGWSGQENEIRIMSHQTFQYLTDAFFNGKRPIPIR